MFTDLRELSARHPFLRRYAEQGFQLSRPVLSLDVEFEIRSPNQTLIVNRQTSDVREPVWF